MKTRRINTLQKLSAWLFCLVMLTQSGIEAPVLCFEADGHVNIEIGCDVSCKVPGPVDGTHQDNCDDCIDIHLWNYNPDLVFIINSNNLDDIDFESMQPTILLETVSEIQPNFHPVEIDLLQIHPLIKTTILLV